MRKYIFILLVFSGLGSQGIASPLTLGDVEIGQRSHVMTSIGGAAVKAPIWAAELLKPLEKYCSGYRCPRSADLPLLLAWVGSRGAVYFNPDSILAAEALKNNFEKHQPYICENICNMLVLHEQHKKITALGAQNAASLRTLQTKNQKYSAVGGPLSYTRGNPYGSCRPFYDPNDPETWSW